MNKPRIMHDLGFTKLSKLLTLIGEENESQIKKWGWQAHTGFHWITILTEEVGELFKAILQNQTQEEIVKEAIQVATLALKIAEMNLKEKNET